MTSLQSNQNIEQLLGAYLDHELPKREIRALEARLAEDPALQDMLASERRFRMVFRERIQRTVAPASLRADVESLFAEHASQPATTPPLSPSSPSFVDNILNWLTASWQFPRWVMVTGTLLLLVATFSYSTLQTSGVVPAKTSHTSFRRLAGKHIVYFTPTPVLDVSGDAAEIDSWFQSRISWPVTVPDLPGWQLVGGRLGEFHHQPMVFLLYEGDGQSFSVIEFTPRETDFPEDLRQRLDKTDIYASLAMERPVVLWQQNGVGYGLIGDERQTTEGLLPLVSEILLQISLN